MLQIEMTSVHTHTHNNVALGHLHQGCRRTTSSIFGYGTRLTHVIQEIEAIWMTGQISPRQTDALSMTGCDGVAIAINSG